LRAVTKPGDAVGWNRPPISTCCRCLPAWPEGAGDSHRPAARHFGGCGGAVAV
jgi:hypothetical protein